MTAWQTSRDRGRSGQETRAVAWHSGKDRPFVSLGGRLEVVRLIAPNNHVLFHCLSAAHVKSPAGLNPTRHRVTGFTKNREPAARKFSKCTRGISAMPCGRNIRQRFPLRAGRPFLAFILTEDRCMRIAQIAPLTEAIPPQRYGGTERVIHWLTEELVTLGHDVTLFASGDSRTSATLEPMWPRALRHDGAICDPNALHMSVLEHVRRRAAEFDFLHFHLDYYPFSLFSRQATPFVTTWHGRLDLPEHQTVFATFADVPVVSISDSQRQPVPQAGWVRTVHHGLPARPADAEGRETDIPRLSRAHIAGEGGRPGDRDRGARRLAAQDRRQGRPGRPRVFRAEDSSAARPAAASNTSARSATRRSRSSSAARWRCWRRSHGPSRSAW